MFTLAAHPFKAAPSYIAEDELRFAAIETALQAAVADTEHRLAAELRRPGGAGQQSLDRDLEVHRLGARLRLLRRHRLDACLGRIVFADSREPLYIGRAGVTGTDGSPLLVDWRSPAAEPFFAATPAQPLGLASRRRYRWSSGRVVDYWDEAFTAEAASAGLALDDESAFIASLGTSRSPRMRDVLATIQADQDAIIRADSRGALVVDGGPGTGKTVVALHRAAYLMYSDPRLGRGRGGVLFVGPHQPYLDYVADVLPSLGEEGVQTCTLRELVPEGADAGDEPDAAIEGLKQSLELQRLVEPLVAERERPPRVSVAVETPWAEVVIVPDEWADAFDAVEPGLPHNEGREQAWDAVVEILTAHHDPEEAPRRAVRAAVARDETLRRVFDRAWPVVDAARLLAELWSDPALLARVAPWLSEADAARLQRADPDAWTTADLPLLDAVRQRVGDPARERREREREAVLAANREQMDMVVDHLIAADDDFEGVVTILRGADAQESLIDESGVPAASADALAGPFAHIIVDEAQELTDAQWQMLIRRCPSRSFTIVGDRAQAREEFAESWDERLRRVGIRSTRSTTLTVNYRTPIEVMEVAEPVIRAVMPDANVPQGIRRSGLPVVYDAVARRDQILGEWLRSHDDGVACVIGDASFASAPRVRSLTPATAKGLEFDLVVLIAPDEAEMSRAAAVDRYVGMTRATQQLVVLS